MKKKLKCTCGKCETCKNRVYMRNYMRKKAKDKKDKKYTKATKDKKATSQPRPKRKFDPEGVEERAARIIKRAKIYGPQFIEVVDNTGLGLEISFCRKMKTLMISVSCKERKPQEVTKMEIKRIRETPTGAEEV